MRVLKSFGLWCAGAILLAGCRSAKPPPPPPQAVSVAERLSSQAEGLSQQGNWAAAVNAWKKAAEQFGLLNNLEAQATALHNQGQAELERGNPQPAFELFSRAAELNGKTRRTNEWWRNQMGLLQAGASLTNHSESLEKRLAELTPKARELREPLTRALFFNELGLWQRRQKRFEEAETSFKTAEQIFGQAQDPTGVAAVLANRALLAEDTANFAGAEAFWRGALSRFESLAQPPGIARALAGLGRSLSQQDKDLPAAEDFLRRAAANFGLLKKEEERRAALAALLECLRKQGKTEAMREIQKQLQPTAS